MWCVNAILRATLRRINTQDNDWRNLLEKVITVINRQIEKHKLSFIKYDIPATVKRSEKEVKLCFVQVFRLASGSSTRLSRWSLLHC